MAEPVIREDKKVEINGSEEIWRLQWQTPPELECSRKNDDWYTGPCMGFSYGESGQLDLVRIKNGHETERLHLTQFFDEDAVISLPPSKTSEPKIAILRKWPVLKGDFDKTELEDEDIHRRRQLDVISIADYNNDSVSRGFFLPTISVAEHEYGVVIGVTRDNPNLHAFNSLANPKLPLYLQDTQWAAVRLKKPKAINWTCGDHGSEDETEEIFHYPKAGGIEVAERTYSCEDGFSYRGKLLSETSK